LMPKLWIEFVSWETHFHGDIYFGNLNNPW
jgi:hypothetical protein